ncbi:ABC transporter permease [Hoeflea sp.]|uniref:ABC transporter permease n=1 Tax=Hoeflea sp. TaxID=1940281 RepID=UPI0019C67A83|nr:ABC transporter permease [Hoeflea sp.]MBC7281057.1 ABC transporter permease [Hoeflea sp.]
MEILERIFNVALIAATLRTTAPILLVALGGTFTTKAGIFNVGLEGQMLIGAFFGVLGSIWTGSAVGGLLIGIAAAMTMAAAFSLFVVTFRANEVVVGLALNLLAGGLTITLTKAFFGTRGSIVGGDIVGFPRLQIPLLEELGRLGKALSSFTPLVYFSFIAVFIVWLILYRTRLGLHIRVAGEKPEAAESLGISTARMQHTASLLCGLFAGLAGTHLSLGYITMFAENMSAGRGFMAVAVLIFSAGDPVKVLIGCLLFGFSDALSLRLQTLGLSSYLVLMVPYLVTLIALFALTYRQRPKIFRETAESLSLIRRGET